MLKRLKKEDALDTGVSPLPIECIEEIGIWKNIGGSNYLKDRIGPNLTFGPFMDFSTCGLMVKLC